MNAHIPACTPGQSVSLVCCTGGVQVNIKCPGRKSGFLLCGMQSHWQVLEKEREIGV